MAYCTVKNWFLLKCFCGHNAVLHLFLHGKAGVRRQFSGFFFSWDHLCFPKPAPGPKWWSRTGCCPAACFQTSHFPSFLHFFPPKKVIKKDRDVSKIRWNSLGCCWHFTVPWEVVQLCLEATGCQQECGSQAEAFHKTQHLATHPQEFRPGNAWQHFCTLEHEQPVVPGPVSSARGAKFSQCFSSILQLWDLSAGRKFESQLLKSSTSASKQDCSGSEQNHHWPDTKSF